MVGQHAEVFLIGDSRAGTGHGIVEIVTQQGNEFLIRCSRKVVAPQGLNVVTVQIAVGTIGELQHFLQYVFAEVACPGRSRRCSHQVTGGQLTEILAEGHGILILIQPVHVGIVEMRKITSCQLAQPVIGDTPGVGAYQQAVLIQIQAGNIVLDRHVQGQLSDPGLGLSCQSLAQEFQGFHGHHVVIVDSLPGGSLGLRQHGESRCAQGQAEYHQHPGSPSLQAKPVSCHTLSPSGRFAFFA